METNKTPLQSEVTLTFYELGGLIDMEEEFLTTQSDWHPGDLHPVEDAAPGMDKIRAAYAKLYEQRQLGRG